MRRFSAVLMTLIMACAPVLADTGNSFTKVRYNAGTLQTTVSPKEWDNKLVITSELISFTLKDGQKVEIDPKTVTSLSYGQEAHRRVGTMVALAILVAPVALFGLFHKTKLHYIGIEFEKDGKKGGLLLQGDKDNYRGILMALKSVTGKDVDTATEDKPKK
jgi:hypothetical protein